MTEAPEEVVSDVVAGFVGIRIALRPERLPCLIPLLDGRGPERVQLLVGRDGLDDLDGSAEVRLERQPGVVDPEPDLSPNSIPRRGSTVNSTR